MTTPETKMPETDAGGRCLAVYYDGSCPMCRSEIDIYQRRSDPSAVAFVDVSTAEASLPDGLDRETALARFHIRDGDGTLVSGAAAFAALWRRTPGFVWLGRLAALPGVTAVLEAGYRGFLVVRPTVQRIVQRLAGRTRSTGDGPECR